MDGLIFIGVVPEGFQPCSYRQMAQVGAQRSGKPAHTHPESWLASPTWDEAATLRSSQEGNILSFKALNWAPGTNAGAYVGTVEQDQSDCVTQTLTYSSLCDPGK